MKSTKTWVLIADAAHARIFENLGPGKGLRELPQEAKEQPVPATREIGADRPGRTHDSTGAARHAMAPRTDWHEQAKEAFARSLGERLNAACLQNAYDRLILVAPPKTLGELRNALTPKTAGFVTAEINKDLTGAALADIEKQIAGVAAI